jgi:hypothetical protein
MTEPSDKFGQLANAYMAEAPSPPANLDVPEVFFYLHYKAFLYLRTGPAAYRETDYFGYPPAHWSKTKLDAVASGCEQILQFRGLRPDRPLEGIGIGGFYALLALFHFERVAQAASDAGPGMMLDRMQMKHGVDGREIVLYNKVVSTLEKPPGPPCPYCGAALRTARAKQCRACGTSWHDPENVIRPA